MDENKQMLELLQQMEQNSRRQVRLGRMQCLFSLTAAVFCGASLLTILWALPQLLAILPQVGTVLNQMQTVLTNLETATEQLSQIDLASMVSGVDTLVTTAQQGLTETFVKLDTIDFKTLNEAIEDLAAVVEPMSRFFKAFSQ